MSGTIEPATASVSTLLGNPVVNQDGEALGFIRDLVIDTDGGFVTYVILAYGGLLTVRAKLFAVPWRALRVAADGASLSINVDRARLDSTPGLDAEKLPDMADRSWGARTHEFFGVRPYWEDPLPRQQH